MIEINLNRKDITKSFVVGLVAAVFVVILSLCISQAHHSYLLEHRIEQLERRALPSK